MNVNEDRKERAARAADAAAQERAGAVATPTGRTAPGYLHAMHPEHGEPVTFVPGELLPDWVVQLMDTGTPVLDPVTGAWSIEPAVKARRSR